MKVRTDKLKDVARHWVKDPRAKGGGYFRGEGAKKQSGGTKSNIKKRVEKSLKKTKTQKKTSKLSKKLQKVGGKAGELAKNQKVQTAGAALGLGTAAYLGYKAADKKYKITDKAVISAAQQAYDKLNETEVDKLVEKSPFNKEYKQKIRNLTGAAKVYAVQQGLKRTEGVELLDVDDSNNFTNYSLPGDAGFVSVGSVGSKVLMFSSMKTEKDGVPGYEMEFKIDNTWDKKPGDRKEGVALARMAKKMYSQQSDYVPDRNIVFATAWAGDEQGSKRASIYEKNGFTPYGESSGAKKMAVVKKEGKLQSLSQEQLEWLQNKMGTKKDSKSNNYYAYQKQLSNRHIPAISQRNGVDCG